jgi:hypothetical protein
MPNYKFPPVPNYLLNSVRDLLDARDHYHVHLSNLPNVVGTAIGRRLMSVDPNKREPKTLFNTTIAADSWPCVLVFVNTWLPIEAFRKQPDQVVPSRLYLPDGRIVPTCVVLVQDEESDAAPEPTLSFPRTLMGGGYLTLSTAQGQDHVGSVGCLVTDGDLTYALTNRHVTGPKGRVIYTVMHGERQRIGRAHANQIVYRPFPSMYPGWAGANVQLQIDAGLIELDDVASWTAQIAGLGTMDEWLDLTVNNLTLDLIDEEVSAFGAASGELHGRIAGLFYRYSTAGGADFVADFLIRPRNVDEPGTLHGDSGTVWVWNQKDGDNVRLRPFAMQWGGHAWVDDSGTCRRAGRFALATSLSVVCRELGVRVIRDWNIGLPEYWGDVGHYTIGYLACDGIGGKLGSLMKANQLNVSYPQTALEKPGSAQGLHQKFDDDFVPLADVPDRLWAHGKMLRGSADGPNHFADMDQKDPQNGNKTLLELCAVAANVNPSFWRQYYANLGVNTKQGLLPFRVWQFFLEMTDARKKKDYARFVAAAGVCAHYVGDACQPLHCSYLHDGYPDGSGAGVHSAYEDTMLKQHAPELLGLLQDALKEPAAAIPAPKTGFDAAVATVDLMRRTFHQIQPADLVDAFIKNKDLWKLFGKDTVEVIAGGVRTLRAIWQGAWNAGGGDNQVAVASMGAADHQDLIPLYLCKTWMPSMSLATIGQVLTGGTSGSAPCDGAAPKAKPVKKGAKKTAVKKKAAKKKA